MSVCVSVCVCVCACVCVCVCVCVVFVPSAYQPLSSQNPLVWVCMCVSFGHCCFLLMKCLAHTPPSPDWYVFPTHTFCVLPKVVAKVLHLGVVAAEMTANLLMGVLLLQINAGGVLFGG